MMAADPNIFQQYLKPVRSVSEYADDMDRRELNALQLMAQTRQNEMAGLQADQTRLTMADSARDRNALERALAGRRPDTTREQWAATLRSTGRPVLMAQADAQEKAGVDLEKDRAGAGKDRATAAKTAADIKYEALDRHARDVSMVQTPEDAQHYVGVTMALNGTPPEQQDAIRAQAMAKFRELGLEGWKQAAKQASIPVLENLKMDAENSRAQLTANTQLTTNRLTNETSRANNAATVAQQERGSLRVDARTKKEGGDNRKANQIQIVEGPNGFEAVDKLSGSSVPVQGAGGVQVMGKRGQATAKAAQDARDVDGILVQAEKLIDGSTGSGVGAAYDKAASFFGSATKGAQKVSSLQALEGSLISKMPRMEGPQSDRDVALYRDAAGRLGDASIPNELKKSAINTIREMQRKYSDRGPPKMPGGGGADPVAEALKKYGG